MLEEILNRDTGTQPSRQKTPYYQRSLGKMLNMIPSVNNGMHLKVKSKCPDTSERQY